MSTAAEEDVNLENLEGAGDNVGTACETDNSDAAPHISTDDMEAVFFGKDLHVWAAEFCQTLLTASLQLHLAREYQSDPSREIADEKDLEATENVRQMAEHVVATLYEFLAAMPIMKTIPGMLDGLHYVLSGIHDVGRGSPPDWLIAKPTKRHPKTIDEQVEWKFIVFSVQLLRLLPDFRTEDAAAKEIARRTKRKIGTIKRWCRKLYCPTRCEVPQARDWIETHLMTISVASQFLPEDVRQMRIENEIRQLLA